MSGGFDGGPLWTQATILLPQGSGEEAGKPTPPHVLDLLEIAFPKDYRSSQSKDEVKVDAGELRTASDWEGGDARSSLTYGEILPRGMSKALSEDRLRASCEGVTTFLELGMGSGKAAIQAFFECPNLLLVTGVELAPERYKEAVAALHCLAKAKPEEYRITSQDEVHARLETQNESQRRVLDFRMGDMCALPNEDIAAADVIFMEVCLPQPLFKNISKLLVNCKDGCRLLMYQDLSMLWMSTQRCPWHPLDLPWHDKYATSWASQGHHFFIFECDNARRAVISVESAASKRLYDGLSKFGVIGGICAGIMFMLL